MSGARDFRVSAINSYFNFAITAIYQQLLKMGRQHLKATNENRSHFNFRHGFISSYRSLL